MCCKCECIYLQVMFGFFVDTFLFEGFVLFSTITDCPIVYPVQGASAERVTGLSKLSPVSLGKLSPVSAWSCHVVYTDRTTISSIFHKDPSAWPESSYVLYIDCDSFVLISFFQFTKHFTRVNSVIKVGKLAVSFTREN